MIRNDAIWFDSFRQKVPKTSVCLLNLQPFAGLEGKCELEAVHGGRQIIEDGSLQLYFSTWPSFPSILVILPLTVDCGDHENMQPQPWLLSFPSLSPSFFLSYFLSYRNAAEFPSLHFLFGHILHRTWLCQWGKSLQRRILFGSGCSVTWRRRPSVNAHLTSFLADLCPEYKWNISV